jgi:predicted house-cleaning noncanonical NTP pyrophosphatase (MazG superfamily)
MGKLVRDRIPEVVTAEDRTPKVRVLDEQEFEAALLDKLVEEVTELRNADRRGRPEEVVDVYQVLLAILRAHGLSAEDLAAAAHGKRRTRGGFTRRLWLEVP